MARKHSSDSAGWKILSARGADQTLANRDVHGSQQLERGVRPERRTTTAGLILATVVGTLVALVAWFAFSLVMVVVSSLGGLMSGTDTGPGPYWREQTRSGEHGVVETCYRQLDARGNPSGRCHAEVDDVPVPRWWTEQNEQVEQRKVDDDSGTATLADELAVVSTMKLFLTAGPGLLVAVVIAAANSKRVAAANLMSDHTDINQWTGDQHIALPEEIMRKFDFFPDAGAHSGVQVSSMVSHVMLQRKGLKKVPVARRATADRHDKDGELIFHKGEAITDDEGETVFDTVPIIDEEFGDALFDASGLTEKTLRTRYDMRTVPYNPDGADRDKLGNHKTVADLIDADWEFPDYEVQRPAGAYVVDTAPVNTMVLAITRAGKGQTVIEPTLDMWSREKTPSNMVINDPKGELLVKNYVPFVRRGFEPVALNLINPMKTDICNPLWMAAAAAREGDAAKCALYIENIGGVFFPVSGGEDPVWPNAANNAFKRAAFGLIDFYLEAERELRVEAAVTGMDPQILEQKLDELWGHVTLYNCYQLFVELTSKKIKNPAAELEKAKKAGTFDDDPDGLQIAEEQAEEQAFLWDGAAESDMLTLYFRATQELPRNSLRTLVGNAHNALTAMAGAEKMMASVYGIAITGMSFFTDPRISALTSGRPSQNIDLAGFSFPRRLGVRFAPTFLKQEKLVGQQASWSAYGDAMFTQDLGKDFTHEEIIGREGWARYNFKGIFPEDQAWLKLEIINPQTNMLIRTMWFHFTKGHQLTLSGRHYVVEPVTNSKIVKNGVLRELLPVREGDTRDGAVLGWRSGGTTFTQDRLDFDGDGPPEKVRVPVRAISQTSVAYTERPKVMWMVTPPNLMKFAKLILIVLKQMVDVSFDQSYMTKANQKPLYRTRYMLDELGNLQSDGHGIDGFETMLSLGLGQEQQFTLILQTLQQLRDVYGESVDRIVSGNTSNIMFLKSTDDAMMKTLETMSGTTHVSSTDSKSVSQNMEKLLGGKTDANVSRTTSTKEEPLIKFNDMAFIGERQSMLFRAGDAPVWNRNETILPMSWRLFADKIVHPGHDYTLQTIPTLSTAAEFDVQKNQPNFRAMLDKRMQQAIHAAEAKQIYQETYGYSDFDIQRLDQDLWSDEIMEIITMLVNVTEGRDPHAPQEIDSDEYHTSMVINDDHVVEDTAMTAEREAQAVAAAELAKPIYAEGSVSRSMLVHPDGSPRPRALELQIAAAWRVCQTELSRDRQHFSIGGDGSLRSADGRRSYIRPMHSQEYASAAQTLNAAAQDPGSRVYSPDELSADDMLQFSTVEVTADFITFLASMPSWLPLAGGEFDRAMAVEMKRGN